MHGSMNIKFIKLFGKLHRRNKMNHYFKGPPPPSVKVKLVFQ
jgi:hypothetical protein